jgi:hypothetical protein
MALVGSLEIHEVKGKIVLKNVRVHPHTLPLNHPKANRKPGKDGLVDAVKLKQMPVDLFKENHEKLEPAQILVFKGACGFYGNAWHY